MNKHDPISKWSSLSFSNKFQGRMRENTNLLFNTYQYGKRIKSKEEVSEKLLDPHRDFQLDAFQEVANSWDMYVRLVAWQLVGWVEWLIIK